MPETQLLLVKAFITRTNVSPSLCDIKCGEMDFRNSIDLWGYINKGIGISALALSFQVKKNVCKECINVSL